MNIDFFDSDSTARDAEKRRVAMLEATCPTDDYLDFGYDYFDNPDLGIGYGGYRYDGRYAKPVASICEHYRLRPGNRVLEIGCAKGYILIEFLKLGMRVAGIDTSSYAVESAHPVVCSHIRVGDACELPFDDGAFNLVFGKEVLPHLSESGIRRAVLECMRVSRGPVFFDIQCGRTRTELEHIKRWDATHKTVKPPRWWDSLFQELNFSGDIHYKVLFPDE